MRPVDSECIFCKIVAGEIPCSKVLESDEVIAFLDIAPVNEGHALVVVKGHYPTLTDVPAELGQELLESMKKVGEALMKVTGADGFNVWQNNHAAAGQLVPHLHFHLIPRFENDGLKLWPQKSYESMDSMNDLAARIAAECQ